MPKKLKVHGLCRNTVNPKLVLQLLSASGNVLYTHPDVTDPDKLRPFHERLDFDTTANTWYVVKASYYENGALLGTTTQAFKWQ